MATNTRGNIETYGFYNWIGDGRRCVAYHEAGHAVALWLIRNRIQHVAIMDRYGYVAGEHVHEAQCLGVVKHDIIHRQNLERLLESKSGVVGPDGKIIPFIEHHADYIIKDLQRDIFVSLSGPVSEALYENEDVFSSKYARPHRSDMNNVNSALDFLCAVDRGADRSHVVKNMVTKIEAVLKKCWNKVEAIANVLERDFVIPGNKLDSIIGYNNIDISNQGFNMPAKKATLEVINPSMNLRNC